MAERRRLSVVALVGLLCLAAGLGCLGWVGYEYLGTGVVSRRAFGQEAEQLQQRWRQTTTRTPEPEKRVPGQAMGLLRIPALGADYRVPVLAGTDARTLARGVGWYENSVRPGEKGNFAVAGHRVTHGEPFADLLRLNVGTEVVVETREATYTYRLITSADRLTVPDTDTWVLDADPIRRRSTASRRYLTLTTCQDLFRSPDRSVAFGELERTDRK